MLELGSVILQNDLVEAMITVKLEGKVLLKHYYFATAMRNYFR